MTTVTVPYISGQVDFDSFADITPISVMSVAGVEDGLAVTFDGDLDDDVIRLVKIRCITPDAAAEALLREAWVADQANSDYLTLPASTPLQDASQVAALTEQVRGMLRLIAPVEGS